MAKISCNVWYIKPYAISAIAYFLCQAFGESAYVYMFYVCYTQVEYYPRIRTNANSSFLSRLIVAGPWNWKGKLAIGNNSISKVLRMLYAPFKKN